MIERILGGSGALSSQPVRPLTRIEQSLAEGIAEKLLTVLAETWGSQPELRLDLAETEHNPLLMQIVGPSEPTVVFTFEVSLGVRTGCIHLALPLKPFDPLLHRLARHAEPGRERGGNTARERERILSKVSGTELTLAAELPAVPIRLQDLLTLRPGDIIDTQISQRSEVALLVEGRTLFRGQPATQDGRRVVRITRSEG
jgi:flagellar motor switch protein FliM